MFFVIIESTNIHSIHSGLLRRPEFFFFLLLAWYHYACLVASCVNYKSMVVAEASVHDKVVKERDKLEPWRKSSMGQAWHVQRSNFLSCRPFWPSYVRIRVVLSYTRDQGPWEKKWSTVSGGHGRGMKTMTKRISSHQVVWRTLVIGHRVKSRGGHSIVKQITMCNRI